MKLTNLFVVLIGAAGLALMTGCGEPQQPAEEETPEAVQTDATTVRSMNHYREEAKREISDENAQEELERLTREIESDAGGT